MPSAAARLAFEYPRIRKAYAALGKATAEAGPLTDHKRQLAKLAVAFGIVSERAVHAQGRRGRL